MLFLCFIAAVPVPGAVAQGDEVEEVLDSVQEQGCAAHPQIEIDGDWGTTGFVLVPGTPSYRPGSGVVAGMGTHDDPFIIGGWCIAVPNTEIGVLLKNTQAHVVIRENWIFGPPVGSGGAHAVRVEDSSNVVIEGNEMERHWRAVQMTDSHGNRIEGNVVHDNSVGIMIWDSKDTVVHGNTVTRSVFEGVLLWVESTGTVITQNVVRDSGRYRGDAGIVVTGPSSRDTVVNDNNIHGNNGNGLEVWSSSLVVDATDNWWGCAGGPTHSRCDSVSGSVDFDPWRSSANPDAGA